MLFKAEEEQKKLAQNTVIMTADEEK